MSGFPTVTIPTSLCALSLSQYLKMMFFCFPKIIIRTHRRCVCRCFSAMPEGWRMAGGRDVFAEFCTEYLKDDLILWSRIVLPTDTLLSHQLATYGNTWDEMSDDARLEAQNLLKGVKAEYVMLLDLKTLGN